MIDEIFILFLPVCLNKTLQAHVFVNVRTRCAFPPHILSVRPDFSHLSMFAFADSTPALSTHKQIQQLCEKVILVPCCIKSISHIRLLFLILSVFLLHTFAFN